jgi:TatD DNase family protein
MYLTDSHCHLDFDAFAEDRELVIQRASDAKVSRMLNPGIDLHSSQDAINLAQRYPSVYAAIGVHPNSATTWQDETLSHLKAMAITGAPRVVAVGEIGLDYYRDRAPKELQWDVFVQQLRLAGELNLPVVIHSRDASPNDRRAIQDVLEILTDWQYELSAWNSSLKDRPGVLHSFSNELKFAQQAIELGFYIGITGPVTFRNASELQSLVAELPLERLLIETDAPFLTPHPYRGTRNEPAYVARVADKIAEIHEQPVDLIAAQTADNAERLFQW